MAYRRLASLDEIRPGQSTFVWAGDKPVILANWDGRVYALDGMCPHQNNPLEGAQVWDHLLECPWHHFQFDIRTGENYYPKNVYPADMPHLRKQVLSLATYPVEVRDGEVWVDLEP